MKKCGRCGAEYADEMKFCGKCGTILPENDPPVDVCYSCGAKLAPDSVFCGKCGARVKQEQQSVAPAQPVKCARCGAELAPDSSFCFMCGTAIGNGSGGAPSVAATSINPVTQPYAETAVQAKPAAPKKKASESIKAAKDKVLAFEKKHGVIVNSVVAVLALIFILVSLLCPVKITMSGVMETDMTGANSKGESVEISQSIWQVLSAADDLDLDMNNAADVAEVDRVIQDLGVAYSAAAVDYAVWAQQHPRATEEEQQEKMMEVLCDHLSDANMFEFLFVYTTIGALDYLEGESVEADMADTLIAMRDIAEISWIFALVTSIMQIGIAVMSLVFLILAIVGIVRKKPVKLFLYMTLLLIVTGVGLAILMVAPMLSASGAMFGMSLTTALVFLAIAIVKPLLEGKSMMFVTKRIVASTLAVIAVFMLCSNVLNVKAISLFDSTREEATMAGPLGSAFQQFLVCLDLQSVKDVSGITYSIIYSDLSMVTAIAALALGAVSFIALYVAMSLSLKKLAFDTESTGKFNVTMLIGAIALLLFAIVPPVIGAIDSMPLLYEKTEMGAQLVIYTRAFVYLAMAFAVAAFVFELIFKPKMKLAPATSDGVNMTQSVNVSVNPVITNNVTVQSQEQTQDELQPATVTTENEVKQAEQRQEAADSTETVEQPAPEQNDGAPTQEEQAATAEVEVERPVVEPQAAVDASKPAAKKPVQHKPAAAKPATKKAMPRTAAPKSTSKGTASAAKKPAAENATATEIENE